MYQLHPIYLLLETNHDVEIQEPSSCQNHVLIYKKKIHLIVKPIHFLFCLESIINIVNYRCMSYINIKIYIVVLHIVLFFWTSLILVNSSLKTFFVKIIFWLLAQKKIIIMTLLGHFIFLFSFKMTCRFYNNITIVIQTFNLYTFKLQN